MYLRYKEWDSDGITAHKGLHGPTEYVFLDENQGVCDVRNKAAIDYFLHHESHRYEIAYERYGVSFGSDGYEVNIPQGTPAVVSSNIAEPPKVAEVPVKRPRGRPVKLRR